MNPATLEVLGEVPLASADEVRAAVAKAEKAFPAWSALSVQERAGYLLKARDYLLEHLDEVCDLISNENGKPRAEALTAEVYVVADLITQYAKRAPKLLADKPIPLSNPMLRALKESRLVHEPLGVISVVSPWNYPFAIPSSGIIFALLAGNTVVFKPASDVALIGLKIDEILRKGGGLPEGVLNTVIASGGSMGTTLFEPPIRKIIFTGSTGVGRKIQEIAARHFIPTIMELGGKDPMIVCLDADLELASSGAVWGAFTNCGQVCASVERIYVHRSIHDRFVDLVVAKTKALRVGPDTGAHDVDVGPMANEEQLEVVEEHVKDALQKGARILAGGRRPEGLSGFFYMPTVMVDADHTMQAVMDETFGPTLPIMAYDTEDEAVRLANDSPFGLTASVWTADRARGESIAQRLKAGSVMVNDATYSYALCETPWQGMKESGIGCSHSDAGLLEMVYPKHINVDRSPSFMKRRMWWFPYSPASYEMQKQAVNAFIKARELPGLVASIIMRKDYRRTLW
jgi:succinate-semialdehyde dehydrogenase/glutarate-semialdehyde dehydrogenase